MSILLLLSFGIVSNVSAVDDTVLPASVNVASTYLLSDTLLTIDDTLTISRTVTNNEGTQLTSFYFHENLPNELSIVSHTVKVNDVVVSYDYPTPTASGSYTNYTEYYWVLDYPGTHGVYDLLVEPDDVVTIEYKVVTSTIGTYDLPMHDFIGHNGTTGLFGYSDTLEIRFFDVSLDIDDDLQLPTNFVLNQNYPNPFNPATTIEFSLPNKSFVTLTVFNVLGQSVNNLINQTLPAGNHEVVWNGLVSNGKSAPSGIYFYKLIAGENQFTKKMVLLK